MDVYRFAETPIRMRALGFEPVTEYVDDRQIDKEFGVSLLRREDIIAVDYGPFPGDRPNPDHLFVLIGPSEAITDFVGREYTQQPESAGFPKHVPPPA